MALCSNARRFAEDLARHCGVVEKERIREEVDGRAEVMLLSLGAMVMVIRVLGAIGRVERDQLRTRLMGGTWWRVVFIASLESSSRPVVNIS